jgi:hypothetical protein
VTSGSECYGESNQAWDLDIPQGRNPCRLERYKNQRPLEDLAFGYREEWKGPNGDRTVRKDISLEGLSSGTCFISPKERTNMLGSLYCGVNLCVLLVVLIQNTIYCSLCIC